MVDLASTAISNTVPIGFAFGLGTTAAMLHSFGFPPAAITRGIALTGIWNNLVKLAMPALALGGLVVVGHAPTGLAVAAVLGSAILLVVVGALVATVTHRSAGARLAAAAEGLASRAARARGRPVPSGWVARTERFRLDSLQLLRHRWVPLTVAAVASHVALFLVLLTCLRAVDGDGSDVSWVVVLAVFAVTRLVTLLPITPGALGVAELSYVAGLTAVGVGAGAAAAAVFLFRFLTWFLPIPLGLAAGCRGAAASDGCRRRRNRPERLPDGPALPGVATWIRAAGRHARRASGAPVSASSSACSMPTRSASSGTASRSAITVTVSTPA